MTSDTLTVTGSFDHNGKTYTYQTEARPKADPTDQEMADFLIAIGGKAPQSRCKSEHQAAIDFAEQQKRELTQSVNAPLLEKVIDAIAYEHDISPSWKHEARAAINTVADWLERESKGNLGSVKHFAKRMRLEAGQ